MAHLAGFLLAKAAEAHGRGEPKDWYDIAFVLLHNDYGGVEAAADRVHSVFPDAVFPDAQLAVHQFCRRLGLS